MYCRKRFDVRIILAVLLVSCTHVFAQIGNSSVPLKTVSFSPKPYKSRQQLKVDSLLAITRPGYFRDKQMQLGKNKSAQNAYAFRVAGCGDGYLCTAKALPVSLISFSGLRLNALEVRLQWETASEENNMGFEVERSIAGTGDYRVVARLDGAGNSAKLKKYYTLDPNTETDISYYRLKQIDLDGSYTYSTVIGVHGFKELISLHALPNPAKQSELYFQLSGLSAKTIDLAIYSVSGATIYKNRSYKPESSGRIPLRSLAKLNTGSYVIKISAGQDHVSASFVVMN
jgi:hypothetical protein